MRICLPLRRIVKSNITIMPIFMPFWGCPQKCIFCAQHSQTGVGDISVGEALHTLRLQLDERVKYTAPPVELGFFGGTFSSMPASVMQECIELVCEYTGKGAVHTARCSTRPDALSPAILRTLRDGGFSTIELGIQSFTTEALQAVQRGYTGDQAAEACHMVNDAGLQLGVQLLPGMPGVSPAIFVNDVKTALANGARILRFYPCLVISGTQLAQLWHDKAFSPWELETTLDALAEGYTLAASQGVPVIRMGLAPEPSLQSDILAGPQHPALGARVQARALVQAAEQALQGRTIRRAEVARSCQGFFWGHKGEFHHRWAALGLTPATLAWHNTPPEGSQCVLYV